MPRFFFFRRHFCREVKETPLGKRNSAPGGGGVFNLSTVFSPHSDTRGDVFVVEAQFARRGNIRRVKAKAYMFISYSGVCPGDAGVGAGVGGRGGIGSVVTTVSS